MKRLLIVCAAAFVSFTAQADTYPSTLGDKEKERHEFYHVQTENFPGTLQDGGLFGGSFGSQGKNAAPAPDPHAHQPPGAHSHAGTRV